MELAINSNYFLFLPLLRWNRKVSNWMLDTVHLLRRGNDIEGSLLICYLHDSFHADILGTVLSAHVASRATESSDAAAYICNV